MGRKLVDLDSIQEGLILWIRPYKDSFENRSSLDGGAYDHPCLVLSVPEKREKTDKENYIQICLCTTTLTKSSYWKPSYIPVYPSPPHSSEDNFQLKFEARPGKIVNWGRKSYIKTGEVHSVPVSFLCQFYDFPADHYKLTPESLRYVQQKLNIHQDQVSNSSSSGSGSSSPETAALIHPSEKVVGQYASSSINDTGDDANADDTNEDKDDKDDSDNNNKDDSNDDWYDAKEESQASS